MQAKFPLSKPEEMEYFRRLQITFKARYPLWSNEVVVNGQPILYGRDVRLLGNSHKAPCLGLRHGEHIFVGTLKAHLVGITRIHYEIIVHKMFSLCTATDYSFVKEMAAYESILPDFQDGI